jgi:hypothetical protein
MMFNAIVCGLIVVLPPLFNPWTEWYESNPLRYTPYPVGSVFKIKDTFYMTNRTPWELKKLPDDWARM